MAESEQKMATPMDQKNQPADDSSANDSTAESRLKTKSLFDQVIALTGLPEDALRKEMSRALADLSQSPEDLDLEKLRALLANYVQDVLVELKDSIDKEN